MRIYNYLNKSLIRFLHHKTDVRNMDEIAWRKKSDQSSKSEPQNFESSRYFLDRQSDSIHQFYDANLRAVYYKVYYFGINNIVYVFYRLLYPINNARILLNI